MGWREAALFSSAVFALLAVVHCSARLAALLWSHPPARNCIIVGSGPRAVAIDRFLMGSPLVQYRVFGFIDQNGTHAVPEDIRRKLLGTVSDLRRILKDEVIDEVFLALPVKSCYSQIQAAIHICEEAGIECKLPSDLFTCALAKLRFEHQDARSMLTMRVGRRGHARFAKAAIDAVGAVAGILVLGLPMLAIASVIGLTSPGPVIFAQRRFGYKKRLFKMYKFRTMSADAEQLQPSLESLNDMGGPVFKMRNDPRVTTVGRLLRKTSLDELPQLWNVLKGDMSLVGPRPLPVRDVSRFNEASLMRRFSVKPGLTCLWQIGGRSETTFERWMQLDLEYIDRWSLMLDLRILAKTVPVVLGGHGAV